MFDPHVLLELDSLRVGVTAGSREHGTRGDARVREALELVLSSIFVKVSRKASDTSAATAPRRIAAGYPARLFVRRAAELAARLSELAARLPDGAAPARVVLEDAKRLQSLGAATIDAVVTSPPYAGTYDYLAHHALRMRWLDLDARSFGDGELGSRRRYAALEPGAARDTWAREIGGTLRALSRVCRKGARVALLLGDSAVQGEALRADVAVGKTAGDAGFSLLARASQRRPHFDAGADHAFRDAPRAEHAMVLEKR
jgi:hypothetical protein